MILDDKLMLKNAKSYAKDRGIRVLSKERLGHGSDGSVWKTNVPSAVKALYNQSVYEVELECYRRLKLARVTKINGFNVPVLEGWSDALRVIEISFVTAPFLLDFGKVHLDNPPSDFYDRQKLAAAQSQWRELFGRHWPDVSLALYLLRKDHNIHYVDPRPGNINCNADDEDDDDWEKEPGVDYDEYS